MNLVRLDLYPLEGEIAFTDYDSVDGRLVFGPDGGLTDERPGVGSGFVLCGSGGGGGKGSGGGGPVDPTAVCKPPAPSKPPPNDVNFAADPYFAPTGSYRVYGRVGGTEHR